LTSPIASVEITYDGSEVLRSGEEVHDDDSADGDYAARQSQRQDDDYGDQPRLVRRHSESEARRHAFEWRRADRPERKRGQNETQQRQRHDDESGATSCRESRDFEWVNHGDQSFHRDRHRYPRRQQLTTTNQSTASSTLGQSNKV